MDMREIDTVPAHTLNVGDYIGLYDHDLQAYDSFEILTIEDFDKGLELTLDWYDEPVVLDYDQMVKLYGY